MQAQARWDDFTERKSEMLQHTHTPQTPWTIIRSGDKHRARLNAMRVILDAVGYEDRNMEIDHVPDPEIVVSGAHEVELMAADRYQRGRVERVMGFCTDEQYRDFLWACPQFENMLIRAGIVLVKFWFTVSDAEQEQRFAQRIGHPEKRWKLSEMDLESRARWVDYSIAKDVMSSTPIPTHPRGGWSTPTTSVEPG